MLSAKHVACRASDVGFELATSQWKVICNNLLLVGGLAIFCICAPAKAPQQELMQLVCSRDLRYTHKTLSRKPARTVYQP